MTIEIKPEVFYYGYWFVGDGKTYDWLLVSWREGDRVRGKFRHRYYAPDSKDPWDEKDRKSWYEFTGKIGDRTDEDVCNTYDIMALGITEVGIKCGQFPPDTVFDIQTNHVCAHGDKFAEELSKAPFVYKRKMSRKEAAEKGLEVEPNPECSWVANGCEPCKPLEGQRCIPCQKYFTDTSVDEADGPVDHTSDS